MISKDYVLKGLSLISNAQTLESTKNVSEMLIDYLTQGDERVMYRLTLKDRGNRMIEVIKEIRSHLQLGLKEAKELSETPNAQLLMSYDLAQVTAFKQALERAGAIVELIGGESVELLFNK